MKRVLLCGNSLLISGLRASLGAAPGLDLQQIDPQADRIRERVEAWKPEILILETGLLKEKVSLSILEKYPQMRLISLDLDDNRLVVLSGSSSAQPTIEELLQVIAA